MNEPLNETGLGGNGLIVQGSHWLSIDTPAISRTKHREAMTASLFRPLHTFAAMGSETPASFISKGYKTNHSGLTTPLPANVAIVTAHSLDRSTLLLRLAHTFEVGEDSVLSSNVTVSLASLFSDFTITSAEERTLFNSKPLAAVEKVTYRIVGQAEPLVLPIVPPAPQGSGLSVTLSAMQIRTFVCNVVRNNAAVGE